jgi:hypothetical protein
MDPSCECDCDCEAWGSRISYEYGQEFEGSREYVIERFLCERCYCKNCAYYWGPTHPNPFRN